MARKGPHRLRTRPPRQSARGSARTRLADRERCRRPGGIRDRHLIHNCAVDRHHWIRAIRKSKSWDAPRAGRRLIARLHHRAELTKLQHWPPCNTTFATSATRAPDGLSQSRQTATRIARAAMRRLTIWWRSMRHGWAHNSPRLSLISPHLQSRLPRFCHGFWWNWSRRCR